MLLDRLGERYAQRPSALIGMRDPVPALMFDIACYREHELDLPNLNKDGSIWTWRDKVGRVQVLRSPEFKDEFERSVAEMRRQMEGQESN